MISELNDVDILDFLMTSEFEGNYKPEELKYLLIKWRYFYRVLNGSKERDITQKDGEIRHLNSEIESLKIQLHTALVEKSQKEDILNSINGKELTWKERISGKIILKTNENK